MQRFSHAFRQHWFALFQAGAGVYLLFAITHFLRLSWRWPLVGDATLMHYSIFLMEHGFAPYRQLVDINLPGTYFFEWLVIHRFGYGALPWRVFDLSLVVCVGGCGLVILAQQYGWRRSLFPGLWVLAVFALVHGRDGLPEQGQRDLLITALLGLGVATLLRASRNVWWMAPFGLAVGTAATIKPWALLLLALPLLTRNRSWKHLAVASAGALFPLSAAFAWIVHKHALLAFWQIMHELVPLHSSLFRKPWTHLLGGTVSSVMLPMFLLALPALWWSKPWRSEQGRVLLAGFAVGCAAFVAQGRGYPYHRYPSEFFLLVLLAGALPNLLQSRNAAMWGRICAALSLLFAIAVIVPRSLQAVARFTPASDPLGNALTYALEQRGGAQLAGQVQCVDMAGGCVTALLKMRLPQSSGFLYDCYAFLPVAHAFVAEQTRYRDAWMRSLQENPPQVLIATADECALPDNNYTLLTHWPAFDRLLKDHYRLTQQWTPATQQHWGDWPAYAEGFRIYERR